VRTHSINEPIGIGAGVVLLDAPFHFGCWVEAGKGKSPQRQYRQSMSLNEIGTLPIRKIAGFAFRANTENAWLGRIGAPERHDRGVSSVIVAPRPAHWGVAGDELDVTPMPAAGEGSTPLFDTERDVWRGVSEAFAEIHKRQVAGGPRWSLQ
jgi:hypothetical protein